MLHSEITVFDWLKMNVEVKNHFQKKWELTEHAQVRTFHGIYHAVTEVAQSLAILFQHKRVFAWFEGWTPVIEPIVTHLMREGYQGIKLKYPELTRSDFSVEDWVEQLPKDTVFVLTPVDHPISGEVNPHFEKLDQLLNQKKIYHLMISDEFHHHRSLPVSAFGCAILNYTASFAAMINGGRYRPPHFMAPYFHYEPAQIAKSLSHLGHENRALVERVAQRWPEYAWSQGHDRLYDRCLLNLKGCNAEAVFGVFCRAAGPGLDRSQIVPISPCHSPLYMDLKKWWVDGEDELLNAGSLLVVKTVLLEDPVLMDHLAAAMDRVLALQSLAG